MEKAKSKYASCCSLISKTLEVAKIAPQEWQTPHKTDWEPDNRQPQGGKMKMGEVWANKMEKSKQHVFFKGFDFLAQGCSYNFLSCSIKLRRFYCCFMNKKTKKIYPVSLVCALIPIILHLFVHDSPCREFQSLNLNFSAVRSYLKHPYILKQQRTIRAVFKLSQQFKSPLLKGLHILWVDDNFVLVFSRVNDPYDRLMRVFQADVKSWKPPLHH